MYTHTTTNKRDLCTNPKQRTIGGNMLTNIQEKSTYTRATNTLSHTQIKYTQTHKHTHKHTHTHTQTHTKACTHCTLFIRDLSPELYNGTSLT